MNQPKVFICFGPYEGYILVQKSVFCCRGVSSVTEVYLRVVISVTEKYLLLQRRIFC